MFYKEYDITVKNDSEDYSGSISGYVTEDINQFNNFLERNSYASSAAHRFDGKRIGIINTMNVMEEERGNGVGTKLLNNILCKMENDSVYYIFLVCDKCESNNFDLQRWYERYGFGVIADVSNCPLMVKCFYSK